MVISNDDTIKLINKWINKKYEPDQKVMYDYINTLFRDMASLIEQYNEKVQILEDKVDRLSDQLSNEEDKTLLHYDDEL